MKMIGKPYSGKPNVRFDEGELEIELSATTPALYSTGSVSQDLQDRSERDCCYDEEDEYCGNRRVELGLC